MRTFLAKFMRLDKSRSSSRWDVIALCISLCMLISYAKAQVFVPHKPLTTTQGSFLAWYQQCAKKNYASCGLLGRAYYEGYGVLPDMTRAKKYFTKACYEGIIESCLLLGNFTREDTKREYAILLYQQACDLNHKESCLKLSDILLKEVTEDTATDSKRQQISTLLGRICELEDDAVCLRKQTFDAQFSSANTLLAVEFQQLFAACKKAQDEQADDMRSCGEVGIKYANGIGVSKDKQEAQAYFKIACEKHSEFCRYEVLNPILN